MERSADWMDQAEGDLEHAQSDLSGGFYDWQKGDRHLFRKRLGSKGKG